MKKLLSVVLAVMIMMSVASFAVSAKSAPACNDTYVQTVGNAPAKGIGYEIRLAIVKNLVAITNAKIECLVKIAMYQKNPDIDKLVAQTTSLAESTIEVGAALGIEVVCEYIPYVINGQTVYIDPLIVIKR